MRRVILAVLVMGFASIAMAEPAKLVDDTWTMKAGAGQTYAFTATKPEVITVSVKGVHHADKGFRIELAPDFMGKEVTRTFTRTFKVAAGARVELRVTNSENMLERMTVHVSVTAD